MVGVPLWLYVWFRLEFGMGIADGSMTVRSSAHFFSHWIHLWKMHLFRSCKRASSVVVEGLQVKGCSRGAGASSQCYWGLSKSAGWRLVSVSACESHASAKAKRSLWLVVRSTTFGCLNLS